MLTNGQHIGHYQIHSAIGAGGMGEVYKAHDARLDREVAIKVLPADFAKDAERLKRFEQEAKATSALNHPNILIVFDIGEYEGSPFIVSELLSGEELRERLNEGSVSARKAIEYAGQIVAGLSAAHEKGIVHRDLKPENIFITKDDRVKILDFGLAKLKPAAAFDGSAGAEDETRKPLTNPGTVMGTVGYMSPEQVRGAAVDHRSDIFSFGVILYEMLAGQKPFAGDSVVETLNAILKTDAPELDGDGATKISPALEKLMRRCLEKKPEHRFHSAHDLGFALEALSASTSSSGSGLTAAATAGISDTKKSLWHRLSWIVAGMMTLIAVIALGMMYFSRSSTSERALWLSFTPPPNLGFNNKENDWAVISPDGQKIAFTAYSPEGKRLLYISELNSREAKPLPSTEMPIEPFWSPDSKSIGFGSLGKLKIAEISGGNSRVLCDAARLTGGAWNKNGVILFGPDYGSALFEVRAGGGEPRQVTLQESDGSDGMHRRPSFLPDGKHFFFARNDGVWVGSLGSEDKKKLLPEPSYTIYSAGYILYVRNQLLVAQGFDPDRLQLSGDPIPVVTGGVMNNFGQVRFSISENGTLVWKSNWEREYQLVWFDREGKQIGAIGTPVLSANGQEPTLSPDGKRLAFKRDRAIWVSELNGENAIKLGGTQLPAWYPDGSRVAFNGNIQGQAGIYERAANGVGEPRLLLKGTVFPRVWTRDGRFLLFTRRGAKTRADIWVLPQAGNDESVYPLLNSAADELQPQVSPDGRWIAYISDESGAYEIYVQALTSDAKLGTERKRISTSGGVVPNWSRDGKELFYVAGDGQMMSMAVKTSASQLETSPPKPLFKTRMLGDADFFHEFDVSPDGQRFLIGTLIGETKAPPPTVILNWMADLKK